MPKAMIEITPDLIKKYTSDKKTHPAYKDTVSIADHLKFHFDTHEGNPFFGKLISDRRPSESEEIKKYRANIYKGKTKAPCFKVLNSLKKIVKSQDWKIDYPKKTASIIADAESLHEYCEVKYPVFKSVENWMVSSGMKNTITDPNGVIAVLPMEYAVESNKYLRPFSYFIPSDRVLEYIHDELIVFQTDTFREYKNDKGEVVGSERTIIFLNKNEIHESFRINAKGEYKTELRLKHGFGYLTAFRAGGVIKEIVNNSPVYVSLLDAMLNDLDVAARETSDLEAEVVQHIYSTMWYVAGQECKACTGTGRVSINDVPVACGKCNGEGRLQKSPYKDIVIAPAALGEQNVPTPPAGYIQKNVEIVKIQDERIKNHIKDALSAVNMEFLVDQPLTQSGVAKEVDRDELNNFVYGVAYHFVENVLKPIYKAIAEYRYRAVLNKNIDELLPNIPVPQKFDLLTENILSSRITSARTAKHDPMIIAELEIDFVSKVFHSQPEITARMKAVKALDPFPNSTATEKDEMVLAGTILKEDAILSNYISFFIEECIQTDKDFLNKTYTEKIKKLNELAKKKAEAMKATPIQIAE
jgi:hypothetical protein